LPRATGRDRRAITIQPIDGVLGMASGNDMKAHASTYDSFIGMLKWSLPLIAVLVAVIVLIIAS
jgi:hypothetical protein